jgi:hypothetical protein
LDGHIYLEICPFLLDFPIYLSRAFQSSPLMVPWISLVFVISHFSFQVLLIWVFFLLILVRFATGLSILFIFSKNQLFVLLILCMVFFFWEGVSLLLLILALIFYYSFLC